jgi:hypothetical protein
MQIIYLSDLRVRIEDLSYNQDYYLPDRVINVHNASLLVGLEGGVDYLLGFESIIEIRFDGAIFKDRVDEGTSPNRVMGEN